MNFRNEFTVLFFHGQTYNNAAKVDLLFKHKGRLVSLRDTLIAAGHAEGSGEKKIYQGRERQFIRDRVSESFVYSLRNFHHLVDLIP